MKFRMFLVWAEHDSRLVAPHILLCGFAPNICQMHVHGLPDLPHSDYPFEILNNFHGKITPLTLKISVQWLVSFLEIFDQILGTFGMSTVD